MFTIEHEFDVTVITLVDETGPGGRPLNEDVVILSFDDRVVIEQMEPEGDGISRITLSLEQLDELRAALNLPEGNYRLDRRPAGRSEPGRSGCGRNALWSRWLGSAPEVTLSRSCVTWFRSPPAGPAPTR